MTAPEKCPACGARTRWDLNRDPAVEQCTRSGREWLEGEPCTCPGPVERRGPTHRRRAEDALAPAPTWPPMRPMEEAPRNYTKVLLRWRDPRDGTYDTGRWDETRTTGRQWIVEDGSYYDDRFLGWYPLPKEAS